MKNRKFNFITLLTVSIVVFVILLGLMYTGIIDEYNGQLLTLAGIYVIISLSLNLMTGFTGQLVSGAGRIHECRSIFYGNIVMVFHIPLFFAIIIGGLITAAFGILDWISDIKTSW